MALLVVEGEIDLSTAPDVSTAIEGVPEAARRVVVDLSEATFLDSAGINALLRCQRELARRDVALRVVSPVNGLVRKALEITNVVAQLGVVDSLEDAAS
jgi:anti-sigma B factor antagonist